MDINFLSLVVYDKEDEKVSKAVEKAFFFFRGILLYYMVRHMKVTWLR
jgi:hypothetical protein